jgi:ABC-type phosphate transport system substrate-binding protein
MRKLLVVAATTVTLGGLGLTATAQAQPGNPATPAPVLTATKTVVANISSSFTVKIPGTSCTIVSLKGPPRALPPNLNDSFSNCKAMVTATWIQPGTYAMTIDYTTGGASKTYPFKLVVESKAAENDAVGVGSGTTSPLSNQLSDDYNGTVSATATHEYNWDAVNPITGQIGDSIPEKTDCPNIARPDGSSAGITQLATFTKSTSGPFCTNFARSGRARISSDPPFAAGGVAFVALAGDAVSWSTQTVTDAPASLTVAQLNEIYTCKVTDWGELGGKKGPIEAFLPQSGSDTLSFWLAAIGVSTPGPCVSNDGNLLAENEGVNKVLQTPEAIFPYSVGDFIAQSQHSAKCLNTNLKAGTACSPNKNGVVCIHVFGKNAFGCDVHGTMKLGEIDGINPILGKGPTEKINPGFPATFRRALFNVVPFDPATTDHIPGPSSPVGGINLEQIFGASGYDCKNSTARTDIQNYGFAPLTSCGGTS